MTDDLLSRLYKAIKRRENSVCIIILPGGLYEEAGELYLSREEYAQTLLTSPPLMLRAPETVRSLAEIPPLLDRAAGGDVWSARDVLVGSLRSREQFDICLRNNFYYIPAERVPEERLPIKYVALFQTPRVFYHDAGVRWYGEVAETQLVRRKRIREVPLRRTADGEKLYYRFTIRRWISLDKPIKPQEFSFVNDFTNLFLLNNTDYVPELLLRSAEEYRFYYALRRLMSRTEDGGFAVNDTAVVLKGGIVQAFRGNRLCAEYPAAEYINVTYTLFRKIQAALAER